MSHSSGPVLLATSLVAGSSELLRRAHTAARALAVPLHRVYAVSAGRGGADEAVLREIEEAARLRFARQDAQLRLPPGDLGETILRRGKPDEVILEEARRLRAGLVILRGSDRGRRIGSTTDRVLKAAEAPVLVVRGKVAAPARRVLFAVQLDGLAEGILRRGWELARALNGGKSPKSEALYALPHLFLDLAFTAQPAHVKHELERASDELSILVTKVAGPDRTFRRTVVHGYPWLEIMRRIRTSRPDLVVLGTHGERGLRRFWLGSVAADVVRSAPCSALVIPPAAAAS